MSSQHKKLGMDYLQSNRQILMCLKYLSFNNGPASKRNTMRKFIDCPVLIVFKISKGSHDTEVLIVDRQRSVSHISVGRLP